MRKSVDIVTMSVDILRKSVDIAIMSVDILRKSVDIAIMSVDILRKSVDIPKRAPTATGALPSLLDNNGSGFSLECVFCFVK